jgi:CRP/FNR family transcriptional regulator, cyclic AMP receptor protein
MARWDIVHRRRSPWQSAEARPRLGSDASRRGKVQTPLDFSILLRAGLPRRAFVADEVIFREGEKGETLYVIEKGDVEIRGGRRVIAILGPGEFFGEMSLIDPSPRSATAVAASDVTLVPVSEKDFLRIVSETPSFALDLLRLFARRLRAREGYY